MSAVSFFSDTNVLFFLSKVVVVGDVDVLATPPFLQFVFYIALRVLGGLNLRRLCHCFDPVFGLALSCSFALDAPYVCTVFLI